jgi:hypothetical protein
MPANTASTVYSATPVAGIDVGAKGSTTPGGLGLLTRITGSDGNDYILCLASEAIGSIATVLVRSAGSASTDAGSAGWTMNAPGGLAAGQYGFARRTSLSL